MSDSIEGKPTEIPWEITPLPRDQEEALEWLLALLAASDRGCLSAVSLESFRKGWFAIAFLYPGLHPDAVLENGTALLESEMEAEDIRAPELRLVSPSFLESGWPVALVPIATEARRRYEAGQLRDEEFYCSEATLAGMCHRDPKLAAEIRRSRAQE